MTIPETVIWSATVAIGSGLIGGVVSIAVLQATKVAERDCQDRRSVCRDELWEHIDQIRADLGEVKSTVAGIQSDVRHVLRAVNGKGSGNS